MTKADHTNEIEEHKPLRRTTRSNKTSQFDGDITNTKVEEGADDEYGFLDYQNVPRIRLGRFEFNTWYGNSALFKEPTPNKTNKTFQTKLAFRDNAIDVNVSPTKKSISSAVVAELNDHLIEFENKKPWIDLLYVCPFCFKFTNIKVEWEHHMNYCKFRTHLPGKVMYNDGKLIVRKVRGVDYKLFCQCMSLMAKFFLDNKSIFYDLDYFDFYVAYQVLDRVEVPMGFYSRELLSWESNNLSCICVMPCYQKRGLGTKLIDFSYKLSEYEQQISGPERPLSPLGKLTYLRYWCRCLSLSFVYGCLSTKTKVTLQMISETIGFRNEDILMALSFLGVLYHNNKKNPNMDYYLERYKYCDNYIFLQDEHYKVYIDKLKIKKWIIENRVTNNSILNDDCFVFY